MIRFKRFFELALIAGIVLMVSGCGGGSSSSNSNNLINVTTNPTPTISSISPSSTPVGSNAFTLTVNGTNFISSSVVLWGGSAKATTYVSSTRLTAAISTSDVAAIASKSVAVTTPSPGGGTTSSLTFSITAVQPLAFVNTALPDAYSTKAYSYTLNGSGGITPYTFTIKSGALPSGLTLSTSGKISGTPAAVSSDTIATFVVQISDGAATPNVLTQAMQIKARSGILGRNDTCSTATPITSGTIRASISPYGDIDVYSFQGTAGHSLTIQTVAEGLSSTNYLDTFLELLRSDCSQITYNDDESDSTYDSYISVSTLPYTGTYYIRVSDTRGDGRPDFLYDLIVTGAN